MHIRNPWPDASRCPVLGDPVGVDPIGLPSVLKNRRPARRCLEPEESQDVVDDVAWIRDQVLVPDLVGPDSLCAQPFPPGVVVLADRLDQAADCCRSSCGVQFGRIVSPSCQYSDCSARAQETACDTVLSRVRWTKWGRPNARASNSRALTSRLRW